MEFLQSVGLLDIVFIVILVVSILLGLLRGAVREVLSLFGLAAAIYLAFKFSDMIAKDYVSQFFEQPRISYVISFVLIIVGTIFAIALVNLLISQLLKASGLSFFNRILGLVFGALRGTVICSILVMVLSFIPGVSQEKWWTESSFAPFFKTIAGKAMGYMPKDVASYVDSTKQTITNVATTANNAASQQSSKGESMRPTTEDKKAVQNILQSIDGSLQETKPAKIQLESSPENSGASQKTEQEKAKLVLESYQ